YRESKDRSEIVKLERQIVLLEEKYRNELRRTEEEREEWRLQTESLSEGYEILERRLGELHNLIEHQRALRVLAEEELARANAELNELRVWKATSIPLSALSNMLQFSQFAALYVNPDDYILFANEEANAQFKKRIGRRLEGVSLWEIASREFMERLKESIEKNRGGFKIQFEGPFYGWYVGIARCVEEGENTLYGYAITHERGLVKKILSLFLPEQEATRRLIEGEDSLIPGKITLNPAGNK
ncbi:MAG: hypothetical protein QXO70_04995, partial [Candidatus Pacearchaeota archaeon]